VILDRPDYRRIVLIDAFVSAPHRDEALVDHHRHFVPSLPSWSVNPSL